jgi:3-deoxy-D-manno-octulosonic-acid transferase
MRAPIGPAVGLPGLALDTAWQAITLAALVAVPVALAVDLARGRGTRGLRERLGSSPASTVRPAWVHAASVGEMAAAAPLVRALGDRVPILVSATTERGRAAAMRLSAHLVAAPFLAPIDAWPCVARAMRRSAPRALLLVETELWPNLVRAASRSGARVIVVNGRLSARSMPRHARVRPLMARTLAQVELVLARSEEDAARFIELGAAPERVVVAGDFKFDAAAALPRQADLPWARAAGLAEGTWVVFGSIAPGEEQASLAAFEAARAAYPELRAVVAPKRPERWDPVARAIAASGRPMTRRSSFSDTGPGAPVPSGGILVLDSAGELARVYRHARVAFVGGSLVPRGGQNVLEPAAEGCPVLHGPDVSNFRDAVQALRSEGGARQVDAGTLNEALMDLLRDDAKHRDMSTRARAAVARHEGAVARALDRLAPLLGLEDVPAARPA